MKKVFTLVFFTLIVTAIIIPMSVDEIISKNLEVKGGIAKLKSIKSVSMEGKMVRMGMEMKIKMMYMAPKMIRTEVTFSDKNIIMAYDGNTAWQISPFTGTDGPQELTGEQADQIKENLDIFDDPFIDYAKKGHKVEFMGKDELEGTDVFKLKLTKKDGRTITYFIDTESFIELKTEMVKATKDGKEIKIETYPGDYKSFEGFMLAYSMKIKVNGNEMGNIVIDNFKFNEKFDTSLFKMPSVKKSK